MKILTGLILAAVVASAAVPAAAQPGARALSIVSPSEQRVSFDDDGSVVVRLAADPPLAEDEMILLRVDDEIVALPSGSTRFTISGVPNGSHVLGAILFDADANPIAAAEVVTFDMDGWLRI
ncbi:MAG: hypothetical protein ACXWG1_18320 [Usitatibacter sp.]